MSVSCFMCEPTETQPVSSAMTRMRWKHGQCGHEGTGHTRSVVLCVGGWKKTWPVDKCSKADAGRSECETPTPCECEQARRQSKTRQHFHCSHVLVTHGHKKLQHTTKTKQVKIQHEPNKQNTMCVFKNLLMYVGA